LEKPENIRKLEAEARAGAVGANGDRHRKWRMVEHPDEMVGVRDTLALGKMRPDHEEEGVGRPEGGEDEEEANSERGG